MKIIAGKRKRNLRFVGDRRILLHGIYPVSENHAFEGDRGFAGEEDTMKWPFAARHGTLFRGASGLALVHQSTSPISTTHPLSSSLFGPQGPIQPR
jgi:hypothetical protein